ncbi:MAG TPA: DHH family phosphoesterase, partial [Verrucomicrobiae bacterium]|nr:DHH family phosphoesterase [Verrucomicrobiae bacterium]
LVKVYGFWNLHALIGGELERLIDHPLLKVMELKRQIEDPLGLEWSRRNVAEIAPNVGFVDTVIGNNNIIVHQLLEQKATPYNVLLTLFRRPNGMIIASLRSRNGEAIKVAEKLQGGGHANASGATLPKSIRTIDDAVEYLRTVLNPPKPVAINTLESLFSAAEKK